MHYFSEDFLIVNGLFYYQPRIFNKSEPGLHNFDADFDYEQSYPLVRSTIESMKSRVPNPKIIIWLGYAQLLFNMELVTVSPIYWMTWVTWILKNINFIYLSCMELLCLLFVSALCS